MGTEGKQTAVQSKLVAEVLTNSVMLEGPYEGEHRVYTLRNHREVEDYFANALYEAGKGETFEGAICLYKKKDGAIGLAFHVGRDAEVVGRSPAGGDEQAFHHYDPQGKTEGSYGRIMAGELEQRRINQPEKGKGITEKLVALAASWCFGPYYCR